MKIIRNPVAFMLAQMNAWKTKTFLTDPKLVNDSVCSCQKRRDFYLNTKCRERAEDLAFFKSVSCFFRGGNSLVPF